jgi:hypothetical protein
VQTGRDGASVYSNSDDDDDDDDDDDVDVDTLKPRAIVPGLSFSRNHRSISVVPK